MGLTTVLTVRGLEGLYVVNGHHILRKVQCLPESFGNHVHQGILGNTAKSIPLVTMELCFLRDGEKISMLLTWDYCTPVCLQFLPKTTVLATWQPYAAAKDDSAGGPDL